MLTQLRHSNMRKKLQCVQLFLTYATIPYTVNKPEGLKVVCNEMNGGSDTCMFNSYWYGTHVIVIGLNFYGDVVF